MSGAVVDHWPHPLTAEGRAAIEAPAGSTVREALALAAPGADPGMLSALLDGEALPPERWGERLRAGQCLTVRAAVAGDDSDPFRLILQIAVVAAAVAVPGALPGLAAWQSAAVGAGVAVVGGLVVAAVAPPRLPDAPDRRRPDPLHSITGGSNRARPYEPLLLVLGEHRVHPDLSAREYAEFRGRDQHLVQQYSWGVAAAVDARWVPDGPSPDGVADPGDALRLSDLRIGDTPLGDFAGVRTAHAQPGADLPEWCHPAVTTAGGAELGEDAVVGGWSYPGGGWTGASPAGWSLYGVPGLEAAAAAAASLRSPGTGEAAPAASASGWIARSTPDGTVRVEIDVAGQLVGYRDDGETQSRSVTVVVQVQSRAPGSSPVTARRVVSSSSADPVRETIEVGGLTAGVHDVRAGRTAWADPGSRAVDRLAVTAVRSYVAADADDAASLRTALDIRASGQLSGRVDRLSGLARRRIPIWRAATRAWTLASDAEAAAGAASNPAAIFLWFARGVRDAAGTRVAGCGLADARIDLDGLAVWSEWCAREGLRCDWVLDRPASLWEVLELVAQCGRASPSWQTGRLGAVWDDPARPPTMLVHPGNVVAGSFGSAWRADRPPGTVEARWIDPDSDWQYAVARRAVDGGTAGETVSVTLRGVTQAAQAKRELSLLAAAQEHHRRTLSWEMGPEGLTAARGDAIWITHSLIDGGAAGRLVGGTAARARLDRRVALGARPAGLGATAPSRILLRLPDGTLHMAQATSGDGADPTDDVALTPPLPADPGADGADPADTLWRHYAETAPPLLATITAVEPQADGTVRLTAIDRRAEYYASDTDDLEAELPGADPRLPTVEDIRIGERPVDAEAGSAVLLSASLTVSGDWRGGVLLAAYDGGPARTVAALGAGEIEAEWPADQDARSVAVTAVPGSEAAPVGVPRTVVHLMRRWSAAGVRWRGDWAAGRRYSPPDAVAHGGRVWVCQAAHTSAAAGADGPPGEDASARWTSLSGRDGADGADGAPGWSGATGTRMGLSERVVGADPDAGGGVPPAGAPRRPVGVPRRRRRGCRRLGRAGRSGHSRPAARLGGLPQQGAGAPPDSGARLRRHAHPVDAQPRPPRPVGGAAHAVPRRSCAVGGPDAHRLSHRGAGALPGDGLGGHGGRPAAAGEPGAGSALLAAVQPRRRGGRGDAVRLAGRRGEPLRRRDRAAAGRHLGHAAQRRTAAQAADRGLRGPGRLGDDMAMGRLRR